MSEVVEIPLLNRSGLLRGVTLVDAEDAARVSQFKWFYNAGYAMTNSPGAIAQYASKINLGAFILGLKSKRDGFPDHINHNTLDNTRKNLRIVTHSENLMNQVRKQALIHGLPVVSARESNYTLKVRITKAESEFLNRLCRSKSIKQGYFVRKLVFDVMVANGFQPDRPLNGMSPSNPFSTNGGPK